MTLIAYGDHNPPAPIDPADYPHKRFLMSCEPVESAPTAILWFDADPLPFDPDAIDVMRNAIAAGGSVLLMARQDAVLTRTAAAVEFILDTSTEGARA